jgi:DNA polymerase
VITLPNGGELKYHHVKIEPGQYGDMVSVYNDQTHSHDHLWGGALTENVVQAISRDVLAEALLRVEARGYHVAMHVHDELVACVPENQGEAALACEIEELSRRPAWAPELPLGAEGKMSRCYTGH